jgi:2-polyprenyl-3-methyl-5-hydroxy-6-metoxy-1,4-benzoquinol methylase
MHDLVASWPAEPLDFSRRAAGPEIMDDDRLDSATYAAVIADLAKVNSITLARLPTINWLKKQTKNLESFTLLDVGFGHGDMLRAIAAWARRAGKEVRLVGVDLNPRSAPAAVAATNPADGIEYVTGQAEAIDFKTDFIISSLVAHHMSDAELAGFIGWMQGAAARGWLINDLHRHWLAWLGFQALARIFGWHPIVRHDGALSVRRAFAGRDWVKLLKSAEIAADVRWHIPFRWTVASCSR